MQENKGQNFRESLGQETNPGAATEAWKPPPMLPGPGAPQQTARCLWPGRRRVAGPRSWPHC